MTHCFYYAKAQELVKIILKQMIVGSLYIFILLMQFAHIFTMHTQLHAFTPRATTSPASTWRSLGPSAQELMPSGETDMTVFKLQFHCHFISLLY